MGGRNDHDGPRFDRGDPGSAAAPGPAGPSSHDLNNLLMVILCGAEAIEEDPSVPPARREDARRIVEATRRITALAREAAPPARPRPVRRRPEGPAQILVVDDDPLIRKVARRALGEAGYDVIDCGGAEEALCLVTRELQSVDLLLTDVSMPGMDGAILARILKVLQPGVRVLYMSGFPAETLAEAFGLGPDGLLLKPFSAEVLRGAVLDALATC